eukprot:7138748-Pyramimonas_sp.AAC.1
MRGLEARRSCTSDLQRWLYGDGDPQLSVQVGQSALGFGAPGLKRREEPGHPGAALHADLLLRRTQSTDL